MAFGAKYRCPDCGVALEGADVDCEYCATCSGAADNEPSAPVAYPAPIQASADELVLSASGDIEYDATVIRAFANRLYSESSLVKFLFAVLGAVAGAAVGGTGLAAVGLGLLAPLLGAAAGLLFGLAIGTMKANALRLQAQLALCQVSIEANTRFWDQRRSA